MENCNPAVAPTSWPKPLGPGPHGKDVQLQDKWSYASVIGLMMYLANNSERKICRYLKGMQPEHLIIKPNMKEMLQVNCFANTDFAGLFSVEDPKDVTL
eukprot:7086401-Ditylum_brightwellii.AAC.1